MDEKLIPISEVFGVVFQGEGLTAGMPTVFVRSGGCDYRCSWCDTLYAVDKKEYGSTWRKLDSAEIAHEIAQYSGGKGLLVTLSGGNPAIWDFQPLIDRLKPEGYTFAIETQGTISQSWFSELNYLTLSPKPPSSGHRTEVDTLLDCIVAAEANSYYEEPPVVHFKIVVFDEADYNYAREIYDKFGAMYPFYLSVGTAQEVPDNDVNLIRHQIAEKYKEVMSWIIRDKWFDVKLGFQQHVAIFGNQRGV